MFLSPSVFRPRSIRFFYILFAFFFMSVPAFSQSPVLNSPKIQKSVQKRINPAVRNIIQTEFVSLEIVTVQDNTHFWQVNVKNLSKKSGGTAVYVQALGFRPQDKSEVMKGDIPFLEAGKIGSARGPLPNFPGMHKLAIKVGGPYKIIKIPRPFRNDADGKPETGLEFNRAWYHRVNGKIRWYLETKPNIYADIGANKKGVTVKLRGRHKKYCHEDKNIEYFNNSVSNTEVIKTGQKYIYSAEVIEHPQNPAYYDYIILNFQGKEHWVELDPSLYNNWKKCDRLMKYPQ